MDAVCPLLFTLYWNVPEPQAEQPVFLLSIVCFCRFRPICLFSFLSPVSLSGMLPPWSCPPPQKQYLPEPPQASSWCFCPQGSRPALRTPTRDGRLFLGDAICGQSSPGPRLPPFPELALLIRNSFFFNCFFNVYLFLRERESESEQGRGKERGRQNPKQAPGSELSAQSPTWGSNSQAVRSRPELKSDAQPTEPPRRP